jgi:hypothetical protein
LAASSRIGFIAGSLEQPGGTPMSAEKIDQLEADQLCDEFFCSIRGTVVMALADLWCPFCIFA